MCPGSPTLRHGNKSILRWSITRESTQAQYRPSTGIGASLDVEVHYLAMGRFFLVKSIRRIEKGMEHTANTLTTL